MLDELVQQLDRLKNLTTIVNGNSQLLLPMQMNNTTITQAMFEDTYHIAVLKAASEILDNFKHRFFELLRSLLTQDSTKAVLILTNLGDSLNLVFDNTNKQEQKIRERMAELSNDNVADQSSFTLKEDNQDRAADSLERVGRLFKHFDSLTICTEQQGNYSSENLSEVIREVYKETSGKESELI